MTDDDQFEEKPRKRQPGPDDDDAAGIKKPVPPIPPRKRPPKPDREDDDDDDRLRRESASSDGGVGYVIPYKNGAALAAYYIGMLCLLLCFVPGLSVFSGLAAVIFGFKGLRNARTNPEAHGSVHAWVGIILGFVQILGACASAAIGIAAIFGGRR